MKLNYLNNVESDVGDINWYLALDEAYGRDPSYFQFIKRKRLKREAIGTYAQKKFDYIYGKIARFL